MTTWYETIFDEKVNVVAVRARREETGYGLADCKRDLETEALLSIVENMDADSAVRFVLMKLVNRTRS